MTMSKRDLRSRRGTQGCSYAGYDFEINLRLAQGFNFLAATAKQQRVSTLQADYLEPLLGVLHQQRVDVLLARALLPAALAHVMDSRCRGDEIEYLMTDEIIVQHDVRRL